MSAFNHYDFMKDILIGRTGLGEQSFLWSTGRAKVMSELLFIVFTCTCELPLSSRIFAYRK